MSDTIQERLRLWSGTSWVPESELDLQNEAADEIDRLTAEVGKWRRQDAMHMGELRDLHKQLAEAKEIIKELEGRNGRIGT